MSNNIGLLIAQVLSLKKYFINIYNIIYSAYHLFVDEINNSIINLLLSLFIII